MKKNDKLNCVKCMDCRYIVGLNFDGFLNIDICQSCIDTAGIPEDKFPSVIQKYNAQCAHVNKQKLDPENKVKCDEFVKTIKKNKDFSEFIVKSISHYLDSWPRIKKENKKLEIISNPENRRIVTPIEDHQFTALHLFTRNQIFQIISKENRSKLIELDEFNKPVDVLKNRSFMGWESDVYFTIAGPILCDYDQKVFDAINKIWHERDTKGIMVETSFSEIWRAIGNKSRIGANNIESLKLSLNRLHKVSIEVKSTENKSYWGGGIIDDVAYVQDKSNKKQYRVLISYNKYMIRHYLNGSYATLSHPVYQKLGSYSRKLYLFIMSHDDPQRKMKFNKWRSPLGVSEEVNDSFFKKKIKESIAELISEDVLDPESKIENDIVCTIITQKAWDARPFRKDNL